MLGAKLNAPCATRRVNYKDVIHHLRKIAASAGLSRINRNLVTLGLDVEQGCKQAVIVQFLLHSADRPHLGIADAADFNALQRS